MSPCSFNNNNYKLKLPPPSMGKNIMEVRGMVKKRWAKGVQDILNVGPWCGGFVVGLIGLWPAVSGFKTSYFLSFSRLLTAIIFHHPEKKEIKWIWKEALSAFLPASITVSNVTPLFGPQSEVLCYSFSLGLQQVAKKPNLGRIGKSFFSEWK